MRKNKSARLSVFKGREAKLNQAIFSILAEESPQAIWDILRNLSKIRGFKRTKYAVINTRIKTLEEKGYLNKTGERATKQAEIKGKLVNFSWKMTNQGYSPETIRTYSSAVRILMDRGADLLDPETVKAVIAKQSWSPNRKQNVINAYTLFLKTAGTYWEKPKCNVVRKLHFIPLEEELDQLIAGYGKKHQHFLDYSKKQQCELVKLKAFSGLR